jgi:predicted O-linked N-acetylglucosamine transferase (SPINDLY family)
MSNLDSRARQARVGAFAVLREAGALHARGRLAEAEGLYRSLLQREPRNFDALHMMGVIALQTGRIQEGIELIERALRLWPEHPRALANLGNGHLHAQRPEQALASYDRALSLDPQFAAVLSNRGNALQSLGRHEEAADSFDRLSAIAPTFDFAVGSAFYSRRQSCDWRDYALRRDHIITTLEAAKRADRPFSFLSVSDSATLQLQCARCYADYLCPSTHPALWRGERYRHDRIRIAYVSADFRDHVVANFMASVYEHHDRERFEITGLSLCADDGSAVMCRTRGALDALVDASRLSDHDAASRLHALEVDIAVDLTGFTQGCRPGIFARRPAPVAVSLLGFPATMGVPFIDYLIGDDFVVPESASRWYSERIVRLPGSFQANDERRARSAEQPGATRREHELPESDLVLCCFNHAHKINPTFFGIWARLMAQVPHCVLWLLGETLAVQQRLRQEMAAHGIAPERLVFAQRLPYPEHLARLRLADLFLDTLPFNAGATASDALSAGVPVLTCAGEAFAARMAGSLLHALGLPELITHDTSSYEQRAIELAGDHAALNALRARLAIHRGTHPLFQAERYCRHLEDAYRQMRDRAERGESPADFSVPPRVD